MGKQPAVIIIARHGARVDQGKKEWHQTAERPWDPPLSYGGWVQSQSLGARIASELQNIAILRPTASETQVGRAVTPPPRKRRKITIHSSPYLRCVQTAIGIAAGLKYPKEEPQLRPLPTPHQRSSLSRPVMLDETMAADVNGPKSKSMTDHTNAADSSALAPPLGLEQDLTELKLDPFLGEWLSSGYFEKITPPPISKTIVTNAKEMLKKPPEDIRGADLTQASIREFRDLDLDDYEDDQDNLEKFPPLPAPGTRAMASIGRSLPKRSRTLSFGKPHDANALSDARNHRRVRSSTIYSPPIPTYSIAPQDTIPPGYVAHARDNCVRPDFDWDSQDPPLGWGDGGEYEEEWSTMHRRFRNGLQSMLMYYDTKSTPLESSNFEREDEDEDEDEVLVLVTHQAGCNALIRLVTGAPALHDVGTASLTLAVRKEGGLGRRASEASAQSPTQRRRGSLDLGLGDEFNMKIIASTEHLHGSLNPLGLNSPRLGRSPAFASRRLAGAESLEGFSIGDPLGWRSHSTNTVTRSSSLRSHTADSSSSSSPTPGSSSGLWTSAPRSNSNATDGGIDPKSNANSTRNGTIPEDEEAWLPDGTATAKAPSHTWQPASRVYMQNRRANQQTTSGTTGLWGGVRDDTVEGGLWGGARGSFGQHVSSNTSARRWTGMGK